MKDFKLGDAGGADALTDEQLRWIADSKDTGTCRSRIAASLASDATPAPTSGSEDGGDWDSLTVHEKAVRSAWNYMQSPFSYSDDEKRFVFELLDDALAKPASEPAGGDVDEIERLTKERNEHANYAAEAIEQRAEMEAQLNSLIRAGGDLRAVSDNGKRWRIVPVDGDWEMVPVGHITARQAEALCKRIAAAALSSSAGPANDSFSLGGFAGMPQQNGEDDFWKQIAAPAVEAAPTEEDYRNARFAGTAMGNRIVGASAHPAPATVEMRGLLSSLAAVVRVQNGNRHADINALLEQVDAALAPATEGRKP